MSAVHPIRPARLLAAPALAGLLSLLAACDTDDGRQLEEPSAQQRADMPTSTAPTTTLFPSVGAPEGDGAAGPADTVAPVGFSLTAPWEDGGAIPRRFTCEGADRPPALSWSAPPAGTVELALLVTDDDADGFVHHAVSGIPPTAGEVGEGGTITGAIEGVNGFGEAGWGGPCPPPGETHTYRWTMYALAQPSGLTAGFAGGELLQHALNAGFTSAEVTGTYRRPE